MKFLIIAVLIFTHSISQANPDYCQVKPIEDVKKVSINAKASYFFRVFPNDDKVSFAADGINMILDLDSKAIVKLPGTYDPVPLGDLIMSVPNKTEGMAYYSISEILKGNAAPPLLYRSVKMNGVYQSTGKMSSGKGFDIFGIIAAGAKEIQFQKIKVTYEPTLKVEPEAEMESLCRGWDIKMPMLSKTGEELSGFDVSAGVSKIWRLDLQTKACIEVDNLGMFAAKADFSYDAKKLAFHLSANGFSYKLKNNGSGEIDWVERPTTEMSQSVFQYDRVTKSLTKISFNPPGSNAYYPVYQKDGSILYALVEPSGASHFELIRPSQISSGRMALVNPRDTYKVLSSIAIGKIWNFACSPKLEIKSPEALSLIALGMNQKNCRDLVREHWNPENHLKFAKSTILSRTGEGLSLRRDLIGLLEPKDLIKICDQLK